MYGNKFKQKLFNVSIKLVGKGYLLRNIFVIDSLHFQEGQIFCYFFYFMYSRIRIPNRFSNSLKSDPNPVDMMILIRNPS